MIEGGARLYQSLQPVFAIAIAILMPSLMLPLPCFSAMDASRHPGRRCISLPPGHFCWAGLLAKRSSYLATVQAADGASVDLHISAGVDPHQCASVANVTRYGANRSWFAGIVLV